MVTKKKRSHVELILCVVIIPALFQCVISCNLMASVNAQQWAVQHGGGGLNVGYDIDIDLLGNVFVTGHTSGFDVVHYQGDAFVSKHDSTGKLLWLIQQGTDEYDQSNAIAIDKSGEFYISGYTDGDIAGPNAGYRDAFLSKFDTNGNLVWSRQFGTNLNDEYNTVTVGPLGNVYVSGTTLGAVTGWYGYSDSFVRKYDSHGELLWTDQFGSGVQSRSTGISSDSQGNVYVSGTFSDLLSGFGHVDDAYLRKYSPSGELLWSERVADTKRNVDINVSADNLGNVFVSGTGSRVIESRPNATISSYDTFVSKFSENGVQEWFVQSESIGSDISNDIGADGLGNVYVSGSIGLFSADGASHDYGVFLNKYNSDGMQIRSEILSSDADDIGYGLGVDRFGNAYVTGYTKGDIAAPIQGYSDFFLAKFNGQIPEPTSTALILSACLCGVGVRRWRLA